MYEFTKGWSALRSWIKCFDRSRGVDAGSGGDTQRPEEHSSVDNVVGPPAMGTNSLGTAACQACGRTGPRRDFQLIVHQRVVLNATNDEILGVEKSPEVNCQTCLAWLDMNVEFYLHDCEKGMEN